MIWFIAVLKKYADFEGRARRKEYWYYVLFLTIFACLFAFVSALINNLILYYIFVLASIIPSIAVGVRRIHDVNKSGWFILIPIYNLILYCTPGTEGPNKY